MMFRTLMALGICVSLSACVSVLPKPKPPNVVYRLSSNIQPVAKLPTAEAIRVDRPTANQVFSTNDIVVASNSQTLSVIAQANWAEAAPVMIQSAMVDALAESPKFVGLIPTTGARTQTRLHLSVLNFETQFDNGQTNPPLGVVGYRVTYAQADTRNLIGTYSVLRSERAESINVSSIVAAIEAANEDAMDDIVKWLETQSQTGGS